MTGTPWWRSAAIARAAEPGEAGRRHRPAAQTRDFRYGMVSAQAAAFHDIFVRAMSVGAASYASAESAAATSFIMGGTFNPQPAPSYVAAINNAFIQSNPLFAGYTPFGLYTPEGASLPFISGMTMDQSIVLGQTILNNAILAQPPGSQTLVVGFSQSATIATLEMRALGALPPGLRPSPADLSFMLLGNPDNPSGGLFERFTFNIPFEGVSTYGATPTDTPHPTTIYSAQYDPIAHFPQYPINILADLNAIAGSAYVHPYYWHFTAEQVQNAVPLATSPGYYDNGGVTHYYMLATPNLPLLDPVRGLPFVGKPLADLLQPDLTVLVNLGYNPNGYADVPTPAQLSPGVDPVNDLFKLLQPQLNDIGVYLPIHPDVPDPGFKPATISGQLLTGAQQGLTDALVDIGVLPPSYYATTPPAVNSVAAVTAVAS
ncbi:MAG: PE-PPE domain-containing protein [Mycobacterium sp.]